MYCTKGADKHIHAHYTYIYSCTYTHTQNDNTDNGKMHIQNSNVYLFQNSWLEIRLILFTLLLLVLLLLSVVHILVHPNFFLFKIWQLWKEEMYFMELFVATKKNTVDWKLKNEERTNKLVSEWVSESIKMMN